MSSNKNIFYEQQLLAIKLSELYKPEVRKKFSSGVKNKSCVLPQPSSIYYKSIVIENDPDSLELSRKNYSENFTVNNKYYKNKGKRYEYDDYNNDNFYNNNEYIEETNFKDEEVEYILVREKRNPYSKRQIPKKSSISNRNLDEVLLGNKKTEELTYECQIESMSGGEGNASTEKLKEEFKKDINEELIKIEDNFTTDNIHTNSNIISNKRFYRPRTISRFDFVNLKSDDNISEDTKCSATEIPDFISEMLYKKISSYTFFKKFTCVKDKNKDIDFFEKELKNNNNSWAQFIKSNVINEKLINNNSYEL
jgi:hypothetical protein